MSVLAVGWDGSLRALPGATVSSGGLKPVSIAVHDNLVYVANAGDGAVNYTGFVLGFDGRLRPLPNSTVALPDGSRPGDVLFNATGTRLAGTRVATLAHRQLHRRARRTAEGGRGVAVRRPGARPLRLGVPAD